MTFFVLLITDRCHIAVHDTRVRALLLITKIWDPNWATHAGPFWTNWAEIWTIFGNPHGIHMKQVDKNRMGPIWVAHIVTQMGPIWGHVFGLTGFISKSLSKLNEDSSLQRTTLMKAAVSAAARRCACLI